MLSSLSKPPEIISTTTSQEIIISKCFSNGNAKLLVIPGGRDLPFCQSLNGLGNKYIREFIEKGGSYLGLCAGGYYGCEAIEFAKGDPEMEICETRELQLYPGTAIGPAYPGFCYTSNKGTKAVDITLSHNFMETTDFKSDILDPVQVYYNGGAYFTPPRLNCNATNVLAYYATNQFPAIVQSTVGFGRVVLTGPHIEATTSALKNVYSDDVYIDDVAGVLESTDNSRHAIFTAIIKYLMHF